MELIELYSGIMSSIQVMAGVLKLSITLPQMFLYSLIGVAIWAGLFILQGIGLSTMAKKRGIEKAWLAYVPFANILLIGKLAGDCQFFGKRIKRAGLWTMLAQIVTTTFMALQIAIIIYLSLSHGAPQGVTQYGASVWENLSGFSLTLYKYYTVSFVVIMPVITLAYQVLIFILMMGLYRRYNPKNHMILGFLALIIPVSRMIVVFVLRNRKSIDFEAYMRARQEAYMRQQQQRYNQYGGNPYGNPYANGKPQNPYGQAPSQGDAQTPPEEPFAEFGSDKKSASESGDTQGNLGDDAKDVFEDIFS